MTALPHKADTVPDTKKTTLGLWFLQWGKRIPRWTSTSPSGKRLPRRSTYVTAQEAHWGNLLGLTTEDQREAKKKDRSYIIQST